MKRGCCLAFGAAWLVAACGGEDVGSRPEPLLCSPIEELSRYPDRGSGPVDCDALEGYEFFVLNTFEPGMYQSGWYTNNDRTALQDPPPDSDPLPGSEIPGGRCVGSPPAAGARCDSPSVPRGECTGSMPLESRFAVHIRTGLMTNGGGVFGHSMPRICDPDAVCDRDGDGDDDAVDRRIGPPEVGACSVGMAGSPPVPGCRSIYDLSDWDGVMVWARKARGSSPTIRVRVSDPLSDDKDCLCNSYTNQNDASDGCDKFGAFATLTEDFEPHFFWFREMQQGGWGLKSPGLDRSDIREVAVEYRHGAWDLWIDDIAFFRRKP